MAQFIQACQTLSIYPQDMWNEWQDISMVCGSSPNNIHHSEDGMVILQFSLDLAPQIGCSVV